MKLSCALEEYLVDLETRNYAKTTIEDYCLKLNRWFRFMEKEDLDSVNIFDVKRYSAHLLKEGKKPSYVNVTLIAIKGFVRWCYDEEIGGWETKKWPYVREESKRIPTFTPGQVRKIIASTDGSSWEMRRNRCLITCFVETGIRASELCNIKPGDIAEDYILIHGKGKKERRVPITPPLKKAMLRYERASLGKFEMPDPYYFLSYRGKKLTKNSLKCIIRKHCKGIEAPGLRCCPHDFRHFFAVQQLKMGRDLFSVSKLMGHSSVKTTAVYASSFDEQTLLNMTDSVLMNL